MGDTRYDRPFESVRQAADRLQAVQALSDEEVIAALAAASRHADSMLSNILGTEALNRVRRMRAALAYMAEGVAALGLDGSIRWLNPRAEKLLACDRVEALGRDFHAFVDLRDANGNAVPREECRLLDAASGAVVSRDDQLFRTRAGELLCVQYTAAPIRDPDGDPSGIVVAFEDCTARKRTERELEESHERYKSLFDSLPEPVISIGPDGAIVDANGAAERLTDRPIEESRGHDFAEYIHPDDVPGVLALFQRVLQGAREEARLRILHKDGHYFMARAVGIPIVVDGEVVGIHGLVRSE